MGEQQQRQDVWFLIREHANGWIAQIEASDVTSKWHVAAYPIEQGQPPLPIKGYVADKRGAMRLADTLVRDHAPHRCDRCGPWRRSDEQRLSFGESLQIFRARSSLMSLWRGIVEPASPAD